MRTLSVPLTIVALASALALSACDGKTDDADHKAPGCPIALKVGPGNAATTAGDTGNVPVTLTNKAGGKCTFEGFPGIELKGSDAGWKATQDKSAKPVKVTLAKGETATFTITYVRGDGGSHSAPVKTVKITVPEGGDAQSFPWSYGDVALKGDTPDASVSPVQVAGD